jgi:hypothetical protein
MPRSFWLRSTAMPKPAARAVVSDDGSTIWLTAYAANGEVVPVAIKALRAVALAGELIEAALPKLRNAMEENSVTSAPERRRGGDPQAAARQQRNADILALAALMGGGKQSDLAEEMAQHLARYRPMPVEMNPTRSLVQKITASGLPVGKRQIRKILAQQKTCLEGHGSPRD